MIRSRKAGAGAQLSRVTSSVHVDQLVRWGTCVAGGGKELPHLSAPRTLGSHRGTHGTLIGRGSRHPTLLTEAGQSGSQRRGVPRCGDRGHRRTLEGAGDARAGGGAKPPPAYRLSVSKHVTRGGRGKPAQDIDERRLARTVRTDQSGDGVTRKLDGDVRQGMQALKAHADPASREDDGGTRSIHRRHRA
jgi:hypothetical protein